MGFRMVLLASTGVRIVVVAAYARSENGSEQRMAAGEEEGAQRCVLCQYSVSPLIVVVSRMRADDGCANKRNGESEQ